MTVKMSDFLIDGRDYVYSLSKLVGKKISDVTGYISDPYGSNPAFGITGIVFDDGSEVGVEGEHDWAYVTTYLKWPQPNLDDETIERLYEESNPS